MKERFIRDVFVHYIHATLASVDIMDVHEILYLPELALHPYSVHFDLSLTVDDQPTVNAQLLNGE